jgi:hypothetical protein
LIGVCRIKAEQYHAGGGVVVAVVVAVVVVAAVHTTITSALIVVEGRVAIQTCTVSELVMMYSTLSCKC